MIKTAAVFSSNMVLQRRKNVKIWGSCSEVGEITVSIPELNIFARASVREDSWSAVLPPMEAIDGCTVKVSSDNSDDEDIVFENVAVGEVWFAGGQSNMEFELQHCTGGDEELKQCENSKVRYYYTEKSSYLDELLIIRERSRQWQLPSEENSKVWSAVAYFFAKKLSAELGVTVGILGCNWGGTSASAWISREKLEENSDTHQYIEEYDKAIEGKTEVEMIWEYNDFLVYDKKWNQKKEACYKENPNMSWEDIIKRCGENQWPGPMGVKNPYRPCGLYETMISRVCPYTLAGFLYYQGESDDHKPDIYSSILTSLIEQWRSDWNDETLPFMIIQLPMFKYSSAEDTKSWAKIREAQMRVFNVLKNTGLVITLDCGELDNIHPAEKRPIAERLEAQVMYQVYGGSEAAAFPPIYKSYSVVENKMEIYFSNAENGIEARGEIAGFEIAGDDGKFYPAKAELNGNAVVIYSDKVAYPMNARYLWTDYAEVKLYGKNGIPIPPFRINR